MEVLYSVQFSFSIVVAIFFFSVNKLLERIYDLEDKNKKTAVELTRKSVEAENINKRYEEIIKFKHYYTSIYRSLVGFIAENDFEGLKNFYVTNISPINSQLNKEVGEHKQIHHIHIPLIKARMIELINTVSQLPNINLYIHVENIIENIAMKEMDLLNIISIYIDNAVEETSAQEDGKITIQMDKTHDQFTFIIKNTLIGCKSTPKPNNTGRGIDLIDEIKENYNTYTETKITYGMYQQRLEVFNE